MRYSVLFVHAVLAKDVPSLDRSVLQQIHEAIDSKLKTDPDVFGKPLRRSLKGYRSLRVGNYRIVYRIEKALVRVVAIIHRSRGYEEVSRRT
ncbi:type II toxin-antitoxin system RelE/ParE family toxin [Candidatus Kaiserbacteria bacterium]|nr:type II toxin-antitoxin system RelE/ParE family toxin [Candidatus Kaiserbacteria bacterium]